jgi:hypothetical protein
MKTHHEGAAVLTPLQKLVTATIVVPRGARDLLFAPHAVAHVAARFPTPYVAADAVRRQARQPLPFVRRAEARPLHRRASVCPRKYFAGGGDRGRNG